MTMLVGKSVPRDGEFINGLSWYWDIGRDRYVGMFFFRNNYGAVSKRVEFPHWFCVA